MIDYKSVSKVPRNLYIMFERNLERRIYNTCMFSVFLEIIHKLKIWGPLQNERDRIYVLRRLDLITC